MNCSIEDIRYAESAFERFYDIGATASGGVTRLGYTREEDQMHDAFAALGREMSLEVYTDEAGNSFASNEAGAGGCWLIGSHLDSVVDGGRYDGVAGILAGLLVMRWILRDGTGIPVKTAAFRCEESSAFGVCTIGSGLVIGKAENSRLGLLQGRDGRTLGEVFEERGYSFRPPEIGGIREYLEVHIEQGRVLEEYEQRIGIVNTIAGHRRLRLHIRGGAEHSGATPMAMRRDALCAAAELILEIERAGISESVRHSVATTGVVENFPNVINVIPGEVRLHVDVRGVEIESLDGMEKRIIQVGEYICDRRGVSFIRERIGAADPVALDHRMQDRLARAAYRLGISHRRMASGAGHDAMRFADICDAGMLFIPCRKGISHNRNEFARMESICEAAAVLYEYLKERWGEER